MNLMMGEVKSQKTEEIDLPLSTAPRIELKLLFTVAIMLRLISSLLALDLHVWSGSENILIVTCWILD